MNQEHIRELKSSISRKRYRHSLAVARLAKRLAQRHKWNPDLAYQAGIFHDCVKEWSPARLTAYVKKNRVSVPNYSFIKKESPNILHAYVGAHFARKKRWVVDTSALRAMRSHTLGRPRMTKEEKILYVADFSSTDRRFRSALSIRRLALTNLERGFRQALSAKITYQLLFNRSVHPLTIRVWNSIQ